MTDRSPTCEPWAEAVSLLAAGCLSADDEREIRQHLATCEACRQRFEQLVVVCREIHAACPSSEPRGADIVARAMSEVLPRVQLLAADSRRRWTVAAGVAIAASLLLVLTWRGAFDSAPHAPDLARQVPKRPVASEQEAGPAAYESQQSPTILAYERALAESDEDFDHLLTAEAQRLVCLSNRQSPVTLFKELAP